MSVDADGQSQAPRSKATLGTNVGMLTSRQGWRYVSHCMSLYRVGIFIVVCLYGWMVSENGHHGLTDEDGGHVDGCTGWRVCSSVMSDEVCRQVGKLVEGQDGVLVLVKETTRSSKHQTSQTSLGRSVRCVGWCLWSFDTHLVYCV